MALTTHPHRRSASLGHEVRRSERTLTVHVAAVVSLLIGGAYWRTVLSDPFFDVPGWYASVAGLVFLALAALAVLRPGLAHFLVWTLVVGIPMAAFVAQPFEWAMVALLSAVFSVPCSVSGALLHSTLRRIAADDRP
jgi:hypothetical protein